MKLKALILSCLLGSFSCVFAANTHLHPKAQDENVQSTPIPAAKKLGWPGYCQIEVINNSYDDVRVFGVFDDGISMQPFNVYSYESPHYISLFYYGYCHDGMDLYIDTFNGLHVYSGYVRRYSTIRIVPSYFGSSQLKAAVETK